MSKRPPNRWGTTSIRVVGCNPRFSESMQELRHSGSRSTGIGTRPSLRMIATISGMVTAVINTCVPGGKASACNSRSNAVRADWQRRLWESRTGAGGAGIRHAAIP